MDPNLSRTYLGYNWADFHDLRAIWKPFWPKWSDFRAYTIQRPYGDCHWGMNYRRHRGSNKSWTYVALRCIYASSDLNANKNPDKNAKKNLVAINASIHYGPIWILIYRLVSIYGTYLKYWIQLIEAEWRIYASVIIDSDNGLSPGRRHAINWTNAIILLIWPLETNFSEILIQIQTFSFKKLHSKRSSSKSRSLCLGLCLANLDHSTLCLDTWETRGGE